MKLVLDPTDLKPEFQKDKDGIIDQTCLTRDVDFNKLNKEAQAAVVLVGQATFYAWNQHYIAVNPPE